MDEGTEIQVEVESTEIVSVLYGGNFENALARLKSSADVFFESWLKEAEEAAAITKTLAITDNDSYVKVGELRSIARGKQRDLEKAVKPMKERVDKVKAVILDAQKVIGAHYESAIRDIDPKLSAWEAKVRREQEAELRKREGEARKRAEKEREAQAKDLLAKGHEEAAEEILNQPIVTPSITPKTELPKVAGQSVRTIHKVKVTNLMALVRAVASGKVPITYVLANEPVLNALAGKLKGFFSCPGCEVVTEESRTSR